jgi:DNA-binding GntR family transcriptional regulator
MKVMKEGKLTDISKEGEVIHQVMEKLLQELNNIRKEESNYGYVEVYISPIQGTYPPKQLAYKFRDLPPQVVITFEVARYTGGNCWNDAVPYKEDTGYKPDTNWLIKLVNSFKPDILLKEYSELKAKLEECNISEREYYGNSTEYVCQYIALNDLLEIIK